MTVARDTAAPVTVAVGGVLDAFPTTEPPATTAERVRPSTTSSSATTSSPVPASPPPSPLPSATVVAARTMFAAALADLVDGAPGEPAPAERVTDDSGRLSIDVPVGWDERDTSTGPLGDGSGAPHVAASPDLRRFLDGYDAAGLTVVVVPGAGDPAALDSYRFDDECTLTDEQPYVGLALTGLYRVWEDCGGAPTDIVTVVAGVGEETVLLLAQVREPADLTALDTALDTLTLLPA